MKDLMKTIFYPKNIFTNKKSMEAAGMQKIVVWIITILVGAWFVWFVIKNIGKAI